MTTDIRRSVIVRTVVRGGVNDSPYLSVMVFVRLLVGASENVAIIGRASMTLDMIVRSAALVDDRAFTRAHARDGVPACGSSRLRSFHSAHARALFLLAPVLGAYACSHAHTSPRAQPPVLVRVWAQLGVSAGAAVSIAVVFDDIFIAVLRAIVPTLAKLIERLSVGVHVSASMSMIVSKHVCVTLRASVCLSVVIYGLVNDNVSKGACVCARACLRSSLCVCDHVHIIVRTTESTAVTLDVSVITGASPLVSAVYSLKMSWGRVQNLIMSVSNDVVMLTNTAASVFVIVFVSVVVSVAVTVVVILNVSMFRCMFVLVCAVVIVRMGITACLRVLVFVSACVSVSHCACACSRVHMLARMRAGVDIEAIVDISASAVVGAFVSVG